MIRSDYSDSNNFISLPNLPRQWQVIVGCVLFGVLGRLLPHLPNMTPFTALSLFAGTKLQQKFLSFSTVIITLIVSDVLIAYFYGFPIFSFWSIFTYSGFLLVTWCSHKLAYKHRNSYLPSKIAIMSLFYWLWTNFGVWLTSSMYPKDLIGFLHCYVMALPFLRNAIIGDLLWGGVIFGAFSLIVHRRHNNELPV